MVEYKMLKKGNAIPVVILLFAIIIGFGYFIYMNLNANRISVDLPSVTDLPVADNNELASSEDIPRISVVAQGLEVPWALVFLPEGGMLVTERKGSVRFISKEGELQTEPILTIPAVRQIGEGGLHGITLHPSYAEASEGKPDFQGNRCVYLYYTYAGSRNETLNRVVRYKYDGDKLFDEEIIVDAIPGAVNHNGGRIKFGPDGYLYIATGDAQTPSLSQDTNSLAGKILRVTDEGDPAPGNPFDFAQDKPFDKRVYSYGHRNPQGIAWDTQRNLWATEHGPSGVWPNCCQDEFNLIEGGANYGWPNSVGDRVLEGTNAPVLHSGREIWAPAGLAYINGKFYFSGLRGAALYEVEIVNGSPAIKTHFKNELGRLREVLAGSDEMLYVTTSNRDGRGIAKEGDDKILRINLQKL